MFLRQSTASQEILLGPFVNDEDGNTAETGLTIAASDIRLFKHGASAKVGKNSGGATHDSAGDYVATLDATDTNTIGNLEIKVHVAGALPVRREFVVLHANVYDALMGTFVLTDPASAPALGTSTVFEGIAALVCHDANGGIKSFNKTTGVMQQKNAAGTNVWTTTATDDGTTRTIGKAT